MFQPLTERQKECLRLTRWMTDKEIAARLGLSEATVKKHVLEACRRLGVNRRKAGLALLETDEPVPAAAETIAAPDGRMPKSDVADGHPASEIDAAGGYRPPPRSVLARVALIGAAAAIGVVLLGLATQIVANQHSGVRTIDKATQPATVATADLA